MEEPQLQLCVITSKATSSKKSEHPCKTLVCLNRFQSLKSSELWPKVNKILENVFPSIFHQQVLWQGQTWQSIYDSRENSNDFPLNLIWGNNTLLEGGGRKEVYTLKCIPENCCYWPWKSLKRSWIQLSKVFGNSELLWHWFLRVVLLRACPCVTLNVEWGITHQLWFLTGYGYNMLPLVHELAAHPLRLFGSLIWISRD